jgi:hypothetical protein
MCMCKSERGGERGRGRIYMCMCKSERGREGEGEFVYMCVRERDCETKNSAANLRRPYACHCLCLALPYLT